MPSLPRRTAATATAVVATCALALAPLTAATAAIVSDPVVHSADDATLSLAPIGSFETGVFDESAAEIVQAYGDRLFVVNAQAGAVSVLDYSDPTAITEEFTLSSDGVANSVAIRPDGLGVIAIEAPVKTDPGHLVFFDANADDAASAHLGEVAVGALPDMVTFSKDGAYAVVANEGEPADDFSSDPEGSIGVVSLTAEIAAPAQSAVRTADFHAYEEGGSKTLPADIRVFGPQPEADLPISRNLEPEYITVDGGTAYASLQEANAFAVVDLATATVTDILPLGFKDHGVVGLDPSDRDPRDASTFSIRTYEGLYGMYMPDGIASYAVDGETYIVSANEGDAREWGDYVEPSRAKDLDVCGDSPLAGLTGDADLGRLNVTTELGFDAEAGCYDELYAYGARSFSIWSADGELVFDSGSEFEEITYAAAPEFFNSNHSESNFEGRSDDKGPEPESVVLGTLSGRTYAFVGFERVGGIAVYDVTEPAASSFVTYINNRDFSVSVEDADDPGAVLSAAGDLGPEGLAFIPAAASATGTPLLAVGNEVSGTTTLFEITDLLAPVNTAAPAITGSADLGKTLKASTGTWDRSGLAFSYQWLRDGAPIAKATSASYPVVAADQGRTLSVQVTAASDDAATSATSAPVTVRVASLAVAVPSKVLATTKDSLKVTVRVLPVRNGVVADGPVTIKVAGKSYTGTVSGGKAVITVGKLPRGIHAIVVAYAGGATVSPTTGLGLVVVR